MSEKVTVDRHRYSPKSGYINLKTCAECKRPFTKGEMIRVITTKNGWFRGDDTVIAQHDQPCEVSHDR